MITADRSLRATIEPLVSTLLTGQGADFPAQAPGLVRTLLWPCGMYHLPDDRLELLRDHALAHASPDVYVKLLRGGEEQPDDDWWWHGEWSADERLDDLLRPEPWDVLLDHVLVDGEGAWAIVFSPEDHGFLIGDETTSRGILDAWATTPQREIAAYESIVREDGWPDLDFGGRVLAHARAGRWW